MANVTNNGDGTLTVTLTQRENRTVGMLFSLERLQQYLTLWLSEREQLALRERFTNLSAADQARVISILNTATLPEPPAPGA